MAYAAHGDVAAEFKGLTFSSSSTPTDTQVTEFLSQEEAVINSWVGKRYTVPVTGTEAVKVCKRLAIQMVAHRIRERNALQAPAPALEQTGRPKKDPYQQALDMLKAIAEGTMPLSDATLASSNGPVESFNVDEETEYVFKRGEKQW